MPKTVWTEKRLGRLFERYNRRYWRGRLPDYVISITPMEHWGQCFRDRHQISIDIDRHGSDREIRSTLLHEMAHAAATGPPHGYQFWAQVERLLRERAPFKISFAEAPDLALVGDAVPRRFPLARKAMKELENKRQKRYANQEFDGEFEIDEEYIAGRFEDAAAALLPWQRAVLSVGNELGLLDVGGKPKNAWAKKAIAKSKKSFLRLRKSLIQRHNFKKRFLHTPAEEDSGT
jgi:hypothetical protein